MCLKQSQSLSAEYCNKEQKMPDQPPWGPARNKDIRYLLNPSQWDEHDKQWFQNFLGQNGELPVIGGFFPTTPNPYAPPGKYELPVHEPQPTPYRPLPSRPVFRGLGQSSWQAAPLEDILANLRKSTTPSFTPTPEQGAFNDFLNKDFTAESYTPPATPAASTNTEFNNTKFMKENREKNVSFENQKRWDEKRKKYISVGNFMKEQEREKAKKAKHE
jgi:hypothetical protein